MPRLTIAYLPPAPCVRDHTRNACNRPETEPPERPDLYENGSFARTQHPYRIRGHLPGFQPVLHPERLTILAGIADAEPLAIHNEISKDRYSDTQIVIRRRFRLLRRLNQNRFISPTQCRENAQQTNQPRQSHKKRCLIHTVMRHRQAPFPGCERGTSTKNNAGAPFQQYLSASALGRRIKTWRFQDRRLLKSLYDFILSSFRFIPFPLQ